MTELTLTPGQTERFIADGIVMLERIVDAATVEALRASFDRLFRGEFETGVTPDEVNWQEGTGDPSLTRQILQRLEGRPDHRPGRVARGFRPRPGRAGGLARRPRLGGQRAVEAARRQAPGISSGRRVPHMVPPLRSSSACGSPSTTPAPRAAQWRWRGALMAGRTRRPRASSTAPRTIESTWNGRPRRKASNPEIVPIVVHQGRRLDPPRLDLARLGATTGATPRAAPWCCMPCRPRRNTYPATWARERAASTAATSASATMSMDENYFPILWSQDGRRTPGLDEMCGI